uniref:DE NOVO DESIGNED PROTEIN, PFK fold n=1 Tax=synthetic construct TaxID=32630 RepID=UPI00024A088A|nr:Chain A, DE NOVO DESIGNED PROTEIN, PFK fold [synthetic construct]
MGKVLLVISTDTNIISSVQERAKHNYPGRYIRTATSSQDIRDIIKSMKDNGKPLVVFVNGASQNDVNEFQNEAKKEGVSYDVLKSTDPEELTQRVREFLKTAGSLEHHHHHH